MSFLLTPPGANHGAMSNAELLQVLRASEEEDVLILREDLIALVEVVVNQEKGRERAICQAAENLYFDIAEMEVCPICDGHGEHTEDCTFNKLEKTFGWNE